MNKLILILILFLSLNSCGQTNENEIDSILLDCLNRSYSEKQVDINKELDKIEYYLIENKILKSSSGQSYFDFYKQIIRLNDIPASLDYERFQNIYKLSPNQFYSVKCLEELKQLDSTKISNSKYYEITIAIQKATQDEVSPSKIAKAITNVLKPSDFDKPYYRAIALLTIAFTSKPIVELDKQFKQNGSKECNSCEVITVSATDKNRIILNEKDVSQEEFEITLSVFIKKNKANHLIEFKADKGTHYDFYMKVQETISIVYNNLKDELANEKFNKPFKELTENGMKEINEIYPVRIKESLISDKN
jgi:biopolymer transport protein ExbD